MRIWYCFRSLFFFVKQIFTTAHYQVVFYAPHHFNRGINGENIYFAELIKICKQHQISFLYLEEPDIYNNQKRSSEAIPFDFLYYLVILTRKWKSSKLSFVEKDQSIGRMFKKIFFRFTTFDNFICISQSMISFFRGLDENMKLFDLQHGTIHSDKISYLKNGSVAENILRNNAYLFLTGIAYKDLLIKHEVGDYFHSHSVVIGTTALNLKNQPKRNKNVLVSLQFTHDHTIAENNQIAVQLEQKIEQEKDFHFFLRNHPRFHDEVEMDRFLRFENVSVIDGNLWDNFALCSLHLTVYSTTAFEAALQGIPTCFLHIHNSKMNIFDNQYHYPYFQHSLTSLYENYSTISKSVKQWGEQFYAPFDKKMFLSALQYAKEKD